MVRRPANATDYLERKTYCQQLMRRKQEVEEKRLELINRKGVVFHHDNARPPTSLPTQQILRKFEYRSEVTSSTIAFSLVSKSSGGSLPFHYPTPHQSPHFFPHQLTLTFVKYDIPTLDGCNTLMIALGLLSVHNRWPSDTRVPAANRKQIRRCYRGGGKHARSYVPL
ncbi:hypothetical protein EVAR_97191_1 [Eumeta japonica]|uniref:Uncharacterized protein n=1 Tax=Eumeta variegata TaxID=151549 RepID=A0A4C1WH56_EUMVA|nr:hypothetical protein EVAR_97191_1 [Eumeta japonica]